MLVLLVIITVVMFLWLIRLQAELDDVKRGASTAEHIYETNVADFNRLLKEHKDEWKVRVTAKDSLEGRLK